MVNGEIPRDGNLDAVNWLESATEKEIEKAAYEYRLRKAAALIRNTMVKLKDYQGRTVLIPAYIAPEDPLHQSWELNPSLNWDNKDSIEYAWKPGFDPDNWRTWE